MTVIANVITHKINYTKDNRIQNKKCHSFEQTLHSYYNNYHVAKKVVNCLRFGYKSTK